MSNNTPYNNNKRRKVKASRLVIVSRGLKDGLSYQDISELVSRELGIKAPSKSTIHNDVQTLLKDWRETNVHNMHELITLELARIDATIVELWDAWRKSKEDQTVNSKKEKGVLLPNGRKVISDDGDLVNERSIKTIAAERMEKDEIGYGDVRYITEIRHQLIERRKILGIYAAEKKEVELSTPTIDVNKLTPEQLRVLTEINRMKHSENIWIEQNT